MIGEVIVNAVIEFVGTVVADYIFGKFLNFIGGTTRWIFGTIWRTILRKTKFEFEEYIKGPKKSKKDFENFDDAHGCVNVVVGVITIASIIILLVVIF